MTSTHDPKRRALLKGAGTTVLILGTAFALPARWLKPVVGFGVLPAHAKTSDSNDCSDGDCCRSPQPSECSCNPQFRIVIEEPFEHNMIGPIITGSDNLIFYYFAGDHGGKRWALYFVGDTDCLPDCVCVTATTYTIEDDILYGNPPLVSNLWFPGSTNTISLCFPKSGGGSVGNGGTVLNTGVNNPLIRADAESQGGALRLEANCVQTMTVIFNEGSAI